MAAGRALAVLGGWFCGRFNLRPYAFECGSNRLGLRMDVSPRS